MVCVCVGFSLKSVEKVLGQTGPSLVDVPRLLRLAAHLENEASGPGLMVIKGYASEERKRKNASVFFCLQVDRVPLICMTTTIADHPIYGQGPLSRADQDRLFGPSAARGVVHTNGDLRYVFVKMGASAKYVNYISRDILLYCWPSFDGADRGAMQLAYDRRTSFLVKVVPHGSTRTYLWGHAVIDEMESTVTEFESEGVVRYIDPTQRRYKITRLISPANDTTPTHAAPVTPVLDTPPASNAASTQVVIAAREVQIDGIRFDSVCEARHHITMTELGIEARREPLSIDITDLLPDGWPQTWYNPDVLVIDPYKGTMLVEIKPCYPYDEEILRCEAACRRLHLPIILFYGTEFRSPYEVTRPADRSYAHAQGPRAILWTFSDKTGTVERVDDVSYMAHDVNGTTLGFIDRRRDSQDTRVYHPKVLQALDMARQRVI